MTEWDQEWQDRISKVVRRVAKDLIANDETEISEVVRRRLFQDLGSERIRKSVARAFGDWCFERRAQLPPEWTAVDSAATERKARELLEAHFEACFPLHPATRRRARSEPPAARWGSRRRGPAPGRRGRPTTRAGPPGSLPLSFLENPPATT